MTGRRGRPAIMDNLHFTKELASSPWPPWKPAISRTSPGSWTGIGSTRRPARGHEQRPHQRMVRLCDATRCARRQAHWGRRRRILDVLCQPTRPDCAVPCGNRACTKCASGSISKAQRLSRKTRVSTFMFLQFLFPVAILAGGLARVAASTDRMPKLLIEVAGEPFFSHQLRLLRRAGCPGSYSASAPG